MPLRRRVSKDVAERYAADERLAATYQSALEDAAEAESALRRAQAEDRPEQEVRALSIALDQRLNQALRAAEGAERVAMGPGTYSPEASNPSSKSDMARRNAEIARRRAKARSEVRSWTDEVDRLRTARERNLLSFPAAARSLA